jgi:hypothetical protein
MFAAASAGIGSPFAGLENRRPGRVKPTVIKRGGNFLPHAPGGISFLRDGCGAEATAARIEESMKHFRV